MFACGAKKRRFVCCECSFRIVLHFAAAFFSERFDDSSTKYLRSCVCLCMSVCVCVVAHSLPLFLAFFSLTRIILLSRLACFLLGFKGSFFTLCCVLYATISHTQSYPLCHTLSHSLSALHLDLVRCRVVDQSTPFTHLTISFSTRFVCWLCFSLFSLFSIIFSPLFVPAFLPVLFCESVAVLRCTMHLLLGF